MHTPQDRRDIDYLVVAAIKAGKDETCLMIKHLEDHLDDAIVQRHPLFKKPYHNTRACRDRMVDAALRRLKRSNIVTFDKTKRVWAMVAP